MMAVKRVNRNIKDFTIKRIKFLKEKLNIVLNNEMNMEIIKINIMYLYISVLDKFSNIFLNFMFFPKYCLKLFSYGKYNTVFNVIYYYIFNKFNHSIRTCESKSIIIYSFAHPKKNISIISTTNTSTNT